MIIRHSRPHLDKSDLRYIQKSFVSCDVGDGSSNELLEKEIAKRAGCKFAVATNSGTAALHLALIALGVSEGDSVVIPSYACGSLLHAVRYCRANPVLADVDPNSYNVTPDTVKEALASSSRVKAVVAIHQFGLPCEVGEILRLGVPVVEDCAVSIGGKLSTGKQCGSAGSVSIFSFYATKLLCTGKGGAAATSDSGIHQRLTDLMQYDSRELDGTAYNYRMPAVNAAFGLSQMKKLSFFLRRRAQIASFYRRQWCKLPAQMPIKYNNIYYRFPLKVLPGEIEELIDYGRKERVEMKRPVYNPLHRYVGGNCPGSEEAFKRTISVPIYPALQKKQMQHVSQVVKDFFSKSRPDSGLKSDRNA